MIRTFKENKSKKSLQWLDNNISNCNFLIKKKSLELNEVQLQLQCRSCNNYKKSSCL